MTKDKRIKKEFDRLARLFAELPSNKLELVTPLMENAAFMRITLDDLQEQIVKGGTTDEYKNGENQFGRKISADIQAYNTTMKVYTSVIDRLAKMLPAEARMSKLEAFTNE